MDLVDPGKRVVVWANKTQPNKSGPAFIKSQLVATPETESTTLVQPKAPAMGASCEDRLDKFVGDWGRVGYP